jgi:hypothetical protein
VCVDGERVTVLMAAGEPHLETHPERPGYRVVRPDGTVILEDVDQVRFSTADIRRDQRRIDRLRLGWDR